MSLPPPPPPTQLQSAPQQQQNPQQKQSSYQSSSAKNPTNNNDGSDVYGESMHNLALLDPPRWGWSAAGGIADLLPPHERARRKASKNAFSMRVKRKRNRAEAFASSEAASHPSFNLDAERDSGAGTTASNLHQQGDESSTQMDTSSSRTTCDDTTRDPSSNALQNGSFHFKALQENGALDIYAYHRGREGSEFRDEETGDLLCDVDGTDTNHGVDEPKMTATITIKFPIEDDDADGDLRYYKETVSWDLSDPQTPTPLAFATDISESFGLTYTQTLELAESVQYQLHAFVNENCAYAPPIALKALVLVDKPPQQAPELYGEVTGRHRSGKLARAAGQKLKPAPRATATASRASKGGKSETVRKTQRRASIEKVEEVFILETRKRLRAASVKDILQKKSDAEPVGVIRKRENHQCHLCLDQEKHCGLFACGVELHGLCTTHLEGIGVTLPSDESPATLDHCPICSCTCNCPDCSYRLESTAAELRSKALEQVTAPDAVLFDDILEYSLKIEPKRRSSVAPKKSAGGGGGGGGGGRWKKRKTAAERPAVPRVPPSEFPREICNGNDIDPGTDTDYSMIYTEKGPRAPTDLERSRIASLTAVRSPGESTPEDGSVDFCNVCKQVGNLICCDFCPRAYHSGCLKAGDQDQAENAWSCPACVRERQGLMEDVVDGKGSRTAVGACFAKWQEDAQGIKLLCMLHQMVVRLIKYDFGYMFQAPVDCSQIPMYKKIVKHPMDLGTIAKGITKGKYRESVLVDVNASLEDVELAILKDIELVWHNCFLFNAEGSAVYRMAEVQRRRALSIRKKSFEDLLSERVKKELDDYVRSCESFRNQYSRDSGSSSSGPPKNSSPSSHPRYHARRKIVVTGNGINGRPIAALDPESGTIAKIYATMQSTFAALQLFVSLKFSCEWEPEEINSNMKVRKIIVESHKDPQVLVFGYRWVFLDELKTGKVAFARSSEQARNTTTTAENQNQSNQDQAAPPQTPSEPAESASFASEKINGEKSPPSHKYEMTVSEQEVRIFESLEEAVAVEQAGPELRNGLISLGPGQVFYDNLDRQWRLLDHEGSTARNGEVRNPESSPAKGPISDKPANNNHVSNGSEPLLKIDATKHVETTKGDVNHSNEGDETSYTTVKLGDRLGSNGSYSQALVVEENQQP